MIGWLDCSAGVSGDMLLGALAGAGVPLEVMESSAAQVAPEPVRLRGETVRRSGLAATRVVVDVAESTTHRTWADVRTLLDQTGLAERVHAVATAAFERLAQAEATVHDTSPDEVQFHEVGALDAIADIVGVAAGFVHLDLHRLTIGTVSLGGGTVESAHGRLPVPAPAVARLLVGVPTRGGPIEQELTTPTGAALITTLATDHGHQPAMTTHAVGVGAGSRDPEGHANVTRLLVGEPLGGGGAELLLQTNVDDLDPRLWPQVLTDLLAAGASDAWLTPILMKKGRPAHTLSVLTPPACREQVLQVVFTQTTTIGLRESTVDKVALERREDTVTVNGESIRVKLAVHAGQVVNAQPEYADVAAAAARTGRSVKDLLAESVAAARHLW